MKSSRVLLVSVFITAVILVMIGGITTIVLANKNAAANASQTVSTETLQAYQQREVQYKQLIQQANQQIEKANADLQTIQSQVGQVQQPASDSQAAAAAPAVAVSADKAVEIARQAAGIGQTATKKPDLVSFEGKAAYEVVFDKGSIYVDAQTGEVLFNGTVPQKITAEKAAQIAGDYLKDHDILQVDQITFRNAPLYRVIFKNGTMAYLDITGQITYVQAAQPKVIIETHSVSHAGSSSAPAPSTGGSTFHEHEDGGGNGGGDN